MRLNMPGRVSVIVNVYNGEDYIADCINSLVSQTYDNLEIVLVDGNSTDRTVEIATSILRDSKRLYLVYNTNGPERYTPMGLWWGYLVGAGNSTGEYLSFHGSDDVSHPDRYRQLVKSMAGDGIVMAYSQLLYVNEQLQVVGSGNGNMNDAVYDSIVNNTDDPKPIHITTFTSMFYKYVYFSEQCYVLGEYFMEAMCTMRMYAAGDFAYSPGSIYYFRNSPRQVASANESRERVATQGYDINELHFGKYNYARSSDMESRMRYIGLYDSEDDAQWSAYVGLNTLEDKRRARARFDRSE